MEKIVISETCGDFEKSVFSAWEWYFLWFSPSCYEVVCSTDNTNNTVLLVLQNTEVLKGRIIFCNFWFAWDFLLEKTE